MKRVKKEFISSAVSHYLRKRQFVEPADSPQKEKQLRCDPGLMSLRHVMSDYGSMGSRIAFSSTLGEPSAFEGQYARFKKFVGECREPLRSELTSILYPLVVHAVLEMIITGSSTAARKFLNRHNDQFKSRNDNCDLLESLQKASIKDEVMEQPDLAEFMEYKYAIHLTENAANSLIQFLKRGDNLLLVQMFNAHFDMKIETAKRDPGAQNSESETKEDEEGSVPAKTSSPAPPDGQQPRTAEEQVTLASLKQCIKKVRQSTPCPPSVCLYSLCSPSQGLCSATISNDQKQICAGFDDSSLVVWSLSPRPIKPQPCEVDVSLVHLSGDLSEDITNKLSRKLNTHSNDGVTLRGHSGSVTSVCYTPQDDLLLSASEDTTVRIWSLSSYTNCACYRGHTYPVWCVHHSPVGSFFASCSADSTVKVWSTERLYPHRSLIGHTGQINVVQYHPNGTYLASGSADTSVRLWSAQEGTCVRLMQGHHLGIHTLAFSPCGKLLASAGEDHAIHIWDLGTGQTVKVLNGHTGVIYSLVFNDDGSLLASGSIDGTLKIWNCCGFKDLSGNSSHSVSNLLTSYSTKPASVLYQRFQKKNILTAAGAVTS